METHKSLSGNSLSVIIPFLNEKEEVARTVESIHSFVGDRVDIIVINDCSDDGYDYPASLAPYHVRYVVNEEREGVAASRDYGVSLSTTPYFLLLDAHMRFYDAGWVDRIVSYLTNDDRVLLCAQTKCLRKDEDGRVWFDAKVPVSYGAYQPLMKGEYWPDTVWNNVERCPGKPEEDIPEVLGAGYAASKRYWTYLRGLEGLLHYGSDEAYISLKVWLEGGRCVLLKDVVIGHIYRLKAPYRMHGDKHVYNYVLISRLLYPQTLRAFSVAMAYHKSKETFRKAAHLWEERAGWIEEMKAYYRSIFTRSYNEVAQINRLVQPKQLEFARKYEWALPLIADKLAEGVPRQCGIVDGYMADMIWLFEYIRYSGKVDLAKEMQRLWRCIRKEMCDATLPFNFRNGLCGIGWGILYLHEKGYEVRNVEHILSAIDGCIRLFNVGIMDDYSLDTGLTGILCYVTARLRNNNEAFDDSFRKDLYVASRRLLEKDVESVSIYYSGLYIDMIDNGVDEVDIDLSLSQWMDFPHFIPQEEEFWTYSLTEGVLGASMMIMLMLKNNGISGYEIK